MSDMKSSKNVEKNGAPKKSVNWARKVFFVIPNKKTMIGR
jgi:hypothetical protein